MNTLPLVILLIGVMLITMLTRVFLPVGQKLPGTLIHTTKLSFRYRLLYHRTSIYMIGSVMVLGGVGGWLSFALQVVMVLAAFAILGIPIKYQFTTQGLALNNVVTRSWDEFQTVERQARVLRLNTAGQGHGFKVLAPSAELDQIEIMANRLVSRSRPAIEAILAEGNAAPARLGLQSRPAKKVRRA